MPAIDKGSDMTQYRKIKPRKLGHLVLAVRDIHKSAAFYTEVLGLEVSDWISDQMCFLRSGADHHDLALAQIPKDSPDIDELPRYSRPGLEHFSYLVDGVEEMEQAAAMLQVRGIASRRLHRGHRGDASGGTTPARPRNFVLTDYPPSSPLTFPPFPHYSAA